MLNHVNRGRILKSATTRVIFIISLKNINNKLNYVGNVCNNSGLWFFNNVDVDNNKTPSK